MILKRIDPMSAARIAGVLYAALGFIVGCFVAVASLFGGLMGGRLGGVFGGLMGLGAIITMPIMYGLLGFIGSLIMAALYNFLAGLVGGVDMHFEPSPYDAARTPPRS